MQADAAVRVRPAMTPESSEGRERIARLEGKVEDVERDVARNERTFGPLPLAVERLQWTIDAINTRLDKRDHADDERFERLARSFENQITVCSSEIANVADTMLAHHRAEHERREEEAKTVRVERTQDIVSRRALYAVLGASAIGAVVTILTPVFNGLFG